MLVNRENLISWQKNTILTICGKHPSIDDLIHFDRVAPTATETARRQALINSFQARVGAPRPIEPAPPTVAAPIEEVSLYNERIKAHNHISKIWSSTREAGKAANAEIMLTVSATVTLRIENHNDYQRARRDGDTPLLWNIISNIFNLEGNELAAEYANTVAEFFHTKQDELEDIIPFTERFIATKDRAIKAGFAETTGINNAAIYIRSLNEKYNSFKREMRTRTAAISSLSEAITLAQSYKTENDDTANAAIGTNNNNNRYTKGNKYTNNQTRFNQKNKITCEFCGKPNHTISVCRSRIAKENENKSAKPNRYHKAATAAHASIAIDNNNVNEDEEYENIGDT